MTPAIAGSATPPKALPVSLWVVQALLGLLFVGTGFWKLLTPIPQLAAMIPWAGQVPGAFLQATAVIDLCGGLGIVLPSLTRIKPGLTVLAALGCAALQVSAIVFHVSRGEAANTPFNFFLVALSLFVFWGRRYRAPIQPRA
ncbi:DoxX family protein [Corallococcus terminator]|uniref:DoxX family protein n=1 Tax=Corallococcus terminator TaxID=2316733 RepID=A0A3A8ILF5_9BACT|nr:DoxX family protein [Corallococcus terminator]RKG84055.1 DoxX family protein [Corallococcus terminator]